MKKWKWVVLALAVATISLSWGTVQVRREPGRRGTDDQSLAARQERVLRSRIPTAQRRAAAARFKQLRQNQLSKTLASGAKMTTLAAPAPDPGGVPHYFGPYPNYANSPLPAGGVGPITINDPGSGYTNPTVVITDLYGIGTGATAQAVLNGTGIGAVNVTSPGTNYYAPLVLITDPAGQGADASASLVGPFTGGLHKFIDRIAGLDPADPNGLGQYIPVAVPDTAAFPGSDYYEIELGQFSEQLHSEMQPTLLRGYRQTNTNDPAVSSFHYLGPLIVAQKNRPVRVKFTNNLPTGAGGNLFIPVDTTLPGAGEGPLAGESYTQNRATIHLHGGFTSWISDGTAHQWVAPAGETTNYKRGLSVFNVPDMPDPGDGSLTFFYGNEQSARLMFYHDHALGITRLNVYAGEAAGYVVMDDVEKDLINGTNTTGVNPALQKILPGVGFPLVIQDRTFVDPVTIYAQDPTWNWGSTPGTPVRGDLWMPHVYMTNQNPYDLSGINAYGRWHYGPWFWPPTTDIAFGPIPNPYFGQNPWEPPTIPATPNPSMAMEAFMDTPLVNGTVYPYLEVEPKVYRFRVLNACNDRFVNLQLYKADPAIPTADGALLNTEVRMVPAVVTPGFPALWPKDGREGGVPDPAMMGPAFIQIGSEGGFLPAPVYVPSQPIDYNMNPTTFNFGNVNTFALLLGAAERADVLVDFSGLEGQTLILYNDAPAAFPALDTRYDYYTGNPDQTGGGGAPSTLAGYGPNTRTIMQIRVTKPLTTPFQVSLPTVQAVWAKSGTKRGVFEASQDPIIIPTDAYNTAYEGSFSHDPYARIFEQSKTFQTLAGDTVTVPFEPKAIHDEMGAAYDTEYGRMSAALGVQLPAQAGRQAFTLYPFASPPVEIVADSMVPLSPVLGDGTQIWKFTHNGVDTHTIHFHLMNVQILNRVAWDNGVGIPYAGELGWKETVRVSPLEDTIVALRPYKPVLPFDLPNSVRPIDVTKPIGATLMGGPGGFKDPLGVPVTVVNHLVNYGWEYVLHCHLLGHEEMDMMHAMAFAVVPNAPSGLVGVRALNGTNVNLTWLDNSANETGFTVQRASDVGFTTNLNEVSFGFNVTNFVDTGLDPTATYFWRVIANNQVGDNQTPGFPVVSVASAPSSAIGYGPGGAIALTLTVPNGGESWNTRTVHNVTWTQSGLTGLANIDLYKGGIFLKNLGTADVTLGTFAWTIGATEATGADYRIRVSQGGIFDDSDANFTIVLIPIQKDDFVGTWDADGVSYRNSDTGNFVLLASPATRITVGDLDGDAIDDLVGLWPGQGGIWVKYAQSGAWDLLSSTAQYIGAGDMNGDGRVDLLGTWDTQGVFYRDSITGIWTMLASPATMVTAGDIDGDGTDDLIGLWPTQGGIWVKYSQSGTWALLSSTAVHVTSGDMNGDGRDDLLGTWDGQGVYYRDSITGTWVLMASPATLIATGDLDGDAIDDLIGIWPTQGGVWVKYSQSGTWQLLSATAQDIAAGKMRAAAVPLPAGALAAKAIPEAGVATSSWNGPEQAGSIG